jgi:hypothetical protein
MLVGALGSLGGAAGLPHAARGQSAVAVPPAPAQPLAQDYTVVLAQDADQIPKLDSVGLAKLPDGRLVAVVTVEPKGPNYVQVVESEDGGATWRPTARLPYNAATPFVNNGALHLFAHPAGTKPYREGDLMLLHSGDGGRSWADPVKLFEGHFWNVQTGMAIRDGHLYWSADDYVATPKRGPRVFAGDLSADLMNPKAWRMSNYVEFPGLPDLLLNPAIKGSYPSQRMLEPNVILVNGRIRVLACVKPLLQATTNLAAVFDLDERDGKFDLSFTQYHPMPGGQVKFCIQWDEVSRLFWATLNLAADGQDQLALKDPREQRGVTDYPGGIGGNDRLMLFYGLDGLNWFPAGCIARAGRLGQSFMYPSHIFDGDDLLVVSRSSINGKNRHDADACTFHRVRSFRNLAMNLRQDET